MPRIRPLLTGAIVAAVAVLFAASPASAHDEVVATDPAADSVLTEAPEQLSITFSSDLLSIAELSSGTAVIVTDEGGTDWVDGEPTVQGDTATVALKDGMPDSAYRVTWQVVSSDGHPTSGEFAFAVEAGEAEATAEPTPAATPEITAEPTAEPEVAPSPTATPEAEEPNYLPGALIGLAGVLALIGIVVWVAVGRKRASDAPPASDTTPTD